MRHRAFLSDRGTRVEALGDLVLEAPLGNRPLAERQREALAGCGFAVERLPSPDAAASGECLLFVDNLFVSAPLLRRFLGAVRGWRGPRPAVLQLAVLDGPLTAITQFTGEQPVVEAPGGRRAFLHGLYHLAGDARSSISDAPVRAVPVFVESGAREAALSLDDRLPGVPSLRWPLTDRVAFEITSWVHLWQANLSFIAVSLFGWLRSPRLLPWALARASWGAVSALSPSPFRLMVGAAGKLVRRGPGCRIHPSAVVEASVLGRGVDIGPLCVVRGSILGDGVRVLEHSVVDGSVLGERVLVNSRAWVKFCLAFPEANFSWLQAGVVGRRAILGRLARPLDMRLEGGVRVRHRDRLVDTGLPFLSCCMGHDALISADTTVAPGRVIPNGYRILSDDSRYVRDVAPGLAKGELLSERDGVVQPRPRKPGGEGGTPRP